MAKVGDVNGMEDTIDINQSEVTTGKLQGQLNLPQELLIDNLYWDRHSSVNSKALMKWFMGGDDIDKEIKSKFMTQLEKADKLIQN